MLGLSATDVARDQLRRLRETNPALFAAVSRRIAEIRRDPSGPGAGRAFRLDDGTLARLATFYDPVAGQDVALVWVVTVDAGAGTMKVLRLEHV